MMNQEVSSFPTIGGLLKDDRSSGRKKRNVAFYCYILLPFLATNGAHGRRSNCFVLGNDGSGLRLRGIVSPTKKWRRPRKRSAIVQSSTLACKDNGNTNNSNHADEHDDDESYLKSLGRRERKRLLLRREHERRRDAWLARYGSADALAATFGTADDRSADLLTPAQTRALYHALLPRSLLALSEYGVLDPSDLAPLAYRARIAAKEYARSRSNLKGRVLTGLVDRYRSWKRGGSLLGGGGSDNKASMTWEDVWEKYEAQIMEQEQERAREEANKKRGRGDNSDNDEETTINIDEEEVMMRIYMRILEKSCATNQAFDAVFLNNKSNGNNAEGGDNNNEEEEEYLASISSRLENDINSILLSPEDAERVTKRRQKLEKKRTRAMEKEEKMRRKTKEKEEKLKKKLEKRMAKLHQKLKE